MPLESGIETLGRTARPAHVISAKAHGEPPFFLD
jgi:hypothetical protein